MRADDEQGVMTMKRKTIILLVTLLAILILGTACGAGLAANDSPAGQAITLIPYTNGSLGLTGLVPEGWLEVKPGQFQPVSGSERVQRGGAWLDYESWVRTTVRHATEPWVRCDDLGFRCAAPAE